MDFEAARTTMLKQQIHTWNVLDQDVLDALAAVPREKFVPAHLMNMAFADMRLDIGHDQQLFLPQEEGKILQMLAIKSDEVVLEIGAGSGYFTALLAKMAKHVYSVEIIEEFVVAALQRLRTQGIQNVSLYQGDGSQGWPDEAPYDVIVIGAALPYLPTVFREQLKVGGRLFVMLGTAPNVTAMLLTRVTDQQWSKKTLYETSAPPLLNIPKQTEFVF